MKTLLLGLLVFAKRSTSKKPLTNQPAYENTLFIRSYRRAACQFYLR